MSVASPRASGGFTASAFAARGTSRSPVEVVLESSTVAHSQEIERRTLREVEEKASELRAQVGASYRSLIASADTIIQMRAVSERCVGALQRMQARLGDLSALRATAEPAPPAAPARQALFAAGCRAKFLLDTPELLWSLLEDKSFAGAAERLAAARDVRQLLPASDRAAFPVLEAAWPGVESFGPAIARRTREALRDGAQGASAVADAALGVALVEEECGALGALGALLDGRLAALGAELEKCCVQAEAGPPGAGAALQAASTGFAAAAAAAQAALCHCGEVFLDAPGTQLVISHSTLSHPRPQAPRRCSPARSRTSLPPPASPDRCQPASRRPPPSLPAAHTSRHASRPSPRQRSPPPPAPGSPPPPRTCPAPRRDCYPPAPASAT